MSDTHDDTAERGFVGPAAFGLSMLMASGAAFILCGYEMIRTTANTLFVTSYGKERLPLGLGLVPIGVTLVLYLYGKLLSWLGPRKTLIVTTLMSVLTMVACYLGIRLGWRAARGVLFIFKESYVVLLIEQVWSYIDSMLSKKSARLLNGPICGVASVGAIIGGTLLGRLSGSWGTLNMVLLSAIFTLPGLLLANLAYRRYGEPPQSSVPRAKGHLSDLGLDLFKKQRILLVLVGLVASAQLVAASQELLFKGLLQDQYPTPDAQNAVSGYFYAVLNGVALVLQLVVAPILMHWVPLSVIHLVIPCIHIGALIYVVISPTLFHAGLAYMLFKTLDYSLFRAAKELLYVPLSFDVRYRAKEIIDVFGYRVSKGVASLSINLLQNAGVFFSSLSFALIGISGATLWLGLVLPISRYDEGLSRRKSDDPLSKK